MKPLQKTAINEVWQMPYSVHKKKSLMGQIKAAKSPEEVMKILSSLKWPPFIT